MMGMFIRFIWSLSFGFSWCIPCFSCHCNSYAPLFRANSFFPTFAAYVMEIYPPLFLAYDFPETKDNRHMLIFILVTSSPFDIDILLLTLCTYWQYLRPFTQFSTIHAPTFHLQPWVPTSFYPSFYFLTPPSSLSEISIRPTPPPPRMLKDRQWFICFISRFEQFVVSVPDLYSSQSCNAFP